MHIETILAPRRAICGFKGGSKKRVLEGLAQTIAQDVPSIDADEVFKRLIGRERLGSTGIGEGIAIPHCRVANCTETTGALITLASPIDYDAIDQEPVDIIFALLVPEEATDEHLQILAELAGALANADYRNRLRSAQDNETLFNAALALSAEA